MATTDCQMESSLTENWQIEQLHAKITVPLLCDAGHHFNLFGNDASNGCTSSLHYIDQ